MATRGRPKKSDKDKLPEGFADGVQAAQTEELKSMVSRIALDLDKVEEDRKNNEGIKMAKEALAEVVGPYSDASKMLKRKIRFIAQVLEERGAK
jgi:hypothetical protein